MGRLEARSPLSRGAHSAQALIPTVTLHAFRDRADGQSDAVCTAAMTASMSGSSPPSIQAARIVSPSWIRKLERAATSSIPSGANATPNALIASPFQSESKGTSTPSDCAQATCDHGESREMTSGLIPAAERSSPLARRSRSSLVQVGDQSQT